MKVQIIIILIFLSLTCGHVWAERPENEMPMYGGDHPSLVESEPPKTVKEKADYKKWSREISQLGWEYFYKSDADTAIKRFNQAWLFDPTNPEVWWGFGVIMGKRGETEGQDKLVIEAIGYLTKALCLEEKNYRIMIDLAVAYMKLGALKSVSSRESAEGSFTSALHWLTKAENEGGREEPLLWGNRALTQCAMGLMDEAIISYSKATKLTPENAAAYNDYAWVLATCFEDKYRNGKKAVELAEKAAGLAPNASEICDTLAAAYAETGQFERAVKMQEKAINLQKGDDKLAAKESNLRLDSYKRNKPWRDQKLKVWNHGR